jgi:polyphosphate glucokinase
MAATLSQRIRRTPLDEHLLERIYQTRYYPTVTSPRPGHDAGAHYAGAMRALGIDIGGSGIKAAPVDVATGTFVVPRQKIATPRPALPDDVAGVVKQLTTSFGWSGPVGITFPGVVADGVTRTAANLDQAWIGLDAAALFGKATGSQVRVLNDADAAGVAEMTFGAGVGEMGTVLMLTFGTGIGSALFTQGVLVPNTEFGHIEIRGHDAETRASERAKDLGDLSWGKWAGRVDEYLQHIEALLSPHLIIVGGGVSKQSEKWVPRLTGIRARIVPATLLNDAGIVGAAMAVATRAAPDTSGAAGTVS